MDRCWSSASPYRPRRTAGLGQIAAQGERTRHCAVAEPLDGHVGRRLVEPVRLVVLSERHERAAESVHRAQQLDALGLRHESQSFEDVPADALGLCVLPQPPQHVGVLVGSDQDGPVGGAGRRAPVFERLVGDVPAVGVLAPHPEVLDTVEDEAAHVLVRGLQGSRGLQVGNQVGVAAPVAGSRRVPGVGRDQHPAGGLGGPFPVAGGQGAADEAVEEAVDPQGTDGEDVVLRSRLVLQGHGSRLGKPAQGGVPVARLGDQTGEMVGQVGGAGGPEQADRDHVGGEVGQQLEEFMDVRRPLVQGVERGGPYDLEPLRVAARGRHAQGVRVAVADVRDIASDVGQRIGVQPGGGLIEQ